MQHDVFVKQGDSGFSGSPGIPGLNGLTGRKVNSQAYSYFSHFPWWILTILPFSLLRGIMEKKARMGLMASQERGEKRSASLVTCHICTFHNFQENLSLNLCSYFIIMSTKTNHHVLVLLPPWSLQGAGGFPGFPGFKGSAGSPGRHGDKGPQGLPGLRGDTGSKVLNFFSIQTWSCLRNHSLVIALYFKMSNFSLENKLIFSILKITIV